MLLISISGTWHSSARSRTGASCAPASWSLCSVVSKLFKHSTAVSWHTQANCLSKHDPQNTALEFSVLKSAHAAGCSSWVHLGSSLFTLPGFNGLSMAKIGTLFWTLLAYHLFSGGHHTRHRRWSKAMYGFWACCQMNVHPRLTCRPIDKAMGQLSRRWIWKSPSSLCTHAMPQWRVVALLQLQTSRGSAVLSSMVQPCLCSNLGLAVPLDFQCHGQHQCPLRTPRNTS